MKFFSLTVAFLITISCATHLNAQQIYTWNDENGVTHITDQPPPKKATVEEVLKYKEKSPQEQAAIERKIEQQRHSNERQDKIDAAQRAEVKARETEKRSKEAMAKAQEETQHNLEYIKRLSNRRWKRKKFRKRIERIQIETEASQAEAEAVVQQAEEAVKKAQQAAAEARESQ